TQFICNGRSPGSGLSANSAGTSCQQILDDHGTGDGIYFIDPQGLGADAAFQVYCDMTTEGGGFTLALKVDGSQTTFAYDAALWTNQTLLSPEDPDLDHT